MTDTTLNKKSNEELLQQIEQFLEKNASVSKLLDTVLPNPSGGANVIMQSLDSIKECSRILKGRADKPALAPEEELKQVATQDCIDSFKALVSQRTGTDVTNPFSFELYKAVSQHARELFSTLVSCNDYPKTQEKSINDIF